MTTRISPGLRITIDKHPTLTHKEVVFADNYILVLFYDVRKDETGNEYFDEFFVTDLQGGPVDYLELSEKEFEWLKQQV